MSHVPVGVNAEDLDEEPSATGCPDCGSDDYSVLTYTDGQPDYAGPKRCEACGCEWT